MRNSIKVTVVEAIRLIANQAKCFAGKFDLVSGSMSHSLYRRMILLGILIGLSVYKPLALFQTLSLFQTIANIIMNILVANLTGAAIYIHNLI